MRTFNENDIQCFSAFEIANRIKKVKKVSYRLNGKYINSFNIPAAFDLETTSFKQNSDKEIIISPKAICDDDVKLHAVVYNWCFAVLIEGITYYFIARSIDELAAFFDDISKFLNLSYKLRLEVFAHNLSYDFEFIKNRVEIDYENLFATDKYKPLYVLVNKGLELRCTYRLTNASLDNAALMVGAPRKIQNYDYNLLRTPATVMTDEENEYLLTDTKIVLHVIESHKKSCEGLIHKIPLTLTGYIRKILVSLSNFRTVPLDDSIIEGKKVLRGKDKVRTYREKYTLNSKISPEDFLLYRQTFMGGFTHANKNNLATILPDVTSIDITSAYTFIMQTGYVPIGNGVELKNIKKLSQLNIDRNCYIIHLTFKKLKLKPNAPDTTLSLSRALNSDYILHHPRTEIDNGRVSKAYRAEFCLTELDLAMVKKYYTFEDIEIIKVLEFKRGKIPKEIREIVLEYFKNKTLFKGDDTKKAEYNIAKIILNSIYGIMVQNIIYDEISLNKNNNWEKIDAFMTLDEQLEKYNENRNRVTSYQWGIWITAHVRKIIHDLIWEIGKDDYVYSDTDSIKLMNYKKHKHIIDKYNSKVENLNLDVQHFAFDAKGNKYTMGLFEFEGTAINFKTLGAKRYIYSFYNNNEIEISATIAGINKKRFSSILTNSLTPFYDFNSRLFISADESGHTTQFISDDFEGTVTDYQGNVWHGIQKGGYHLEDSSFSFLNDDDVLNNLNNVDIFRRKIHSAIIYKRELLQRTTNLKQLEIRDIVNEEYRTLLLTG